MNITVVKPDANIETTSYCHQLPNGKKIPVEYYEVINTIQIDTDKFFDLLDFNKMARK
jgi:hypothetical protein